MTDPVPAPDPVAAAMRLRASDADRERVAAVLRDAYVDGRLSPSEHEERLSGVYQASTYADLVPLLADLPVPPGTIAVPGVGSGIAITHPQNPGVAGPSALVDPSRAEQAQGPAVAIFSGVERKGRWVVPARLSVVTIMGGADLDLTDAIFTAQETVVTVVAIMGGAQLRVPDGIDVHMEVFGFMGGTAGPSGDPPPGAPVLRVNGIAIMGGVEVKRSKRPRGGAQQVDPRRDNPGELGR